MQMHQLNHRQAIPIRQLTDHKAGMAAVLEHIVKQMMLTLPDAEFIEFNLVKFEADDEHDADR